MAKIMILVSALMTANLWHTAQAQLNPVPPVVPANGIGYAYFIAPAAAQNPQLLLNSVGGPLIAAGPGGAPGTFGLVPTFGANPSYRYGYQVADRRYGDLRLQQETRDGNNVVGQYALQEPNGNLRTVNYVASNNGFQAQVPNTAG